MTNLLALTIPGENGTGVPISPPPGIPSGLSISTIATNSLQAAMVIGFLLATIYLCYGGFFWMQSKGDKEKLDKSRRIITYSLMGIIIMAFALLFVNLLAHALGVNVLIQEGH